MYVLKIMVCAQRNEIYCSLLEPYAEFRRACLFLIGRKRNFSKHRKTLFNPHLKMLLLFKCWTIRKPLGYELNFYRPNWTLHLGLGYEYQGEIIEGELISTHFHPFSLFNAPIYLRHKIIRKSGLYRVSYLPFWILCHVCTYKYIRVQV